MDIMVNILQQAIQAGLLNRMNPMETYKNMLATKGMQTDIRSAELNQEGKVIEMSKEYIKRTADFEEYNQKTRPYLVDKLGVSAELLPESFESDEEFKEWQISATASADALLKRSQGKPYTVSIIRPDGSVSIDEKMTDERYKSFVEKGIIDPKNIMIGKQTKESFENERKRAAAKEKGKAAEAGKKEGKADRIWVTKGNRKKQVRQYSKEHLDAIKDDWVEGQPISTARPPAGQTYRLSDGTRVRSFDGGRTYVDDEGVNRPLPTDAIPMEVKFTGEDIRMEEAQEKAAKKLGAVQERAELPTAEEAARGGTGPFAKVAAAIDAVAGGLNIDLIFGKEGFFPDTQENRQLLRTIKQLGKSALMNSSRGAIWEQEKIEKLFPDPDKTWRNPRTEAKKFIVLRETLMTERNFNLEAITSAVSPKEVDKLRGSNLEIDRLLALIKPAEETSAGPSGLTQEDEALINKYLRQ